MKLLALGLPLLLLLPQAQEAASYSERIEQVVAAHAAGELEAALATLDPLLGAPVEAGDGEEAGAAPALQLTERQRAQVQYALGVLLAARNDLPRDPLNPPPDLLEAAPPFESARALAGPSPLRMDATYDLGGVYLLEGERLRLTLPELANAGAQALPAAPPPSMPSGAGLPEGSDPLERARAAYLGAKEHLLERLRADWRDEDTRANLELIQRRLAELDRIQEEREQQQQEQEQQQDEEGEKGEGEEGEQQESDEESEGDESSEDDPSESDSEGNPEQQEPQGGPPQEQETQETQPPEEGGEAQQAESTEPEERLLTREEVMRLLDRLGELEEQREQLDAALRQSQRVPVPRDW